MMQAVCVFLYAMLTPAVNDSTIRVNQRPVVISSPPIIERLDDGSEVVFVSADAFAKAAGLEAKTVKPGRLIVLCSPAWCRPVHLKPADVRVSNGRTLVKLQVLAGACGMRVEITKTEGGDPVIDIESKSKSGNDAGGGLSEGSMLPDVTLVDLKGEEVRLSRFLGKRMLICTWASW